MGNWSHVKATATRLPLERRAIDQALTGAPLQLRRATYLVLLRRIWLAIRRDQSARMVPEAFFR
jgi:hypothetical protein